MEYHSKGALVKCKWMTLTLVHGDKTHGILVGTELLLELLLAYDLTLRP